MDWNLARYGSPGLTILTSHLQLTTRRIVSATILVLLLGLVSTPRTGSAAGTVGAASPLPGGPGAPAATYCASGTVWTDHNIDGSLNNGETGSGNSGWNIEVDYYFAGWNFSGNTATDSNGNWSVCGLNGALYRRAWITSGPASWTGTTSGQIGFYMGAYDVGGLNFGIARADLSTSISP